MINRKIKWALVGYDTVVFLLVGVVISFLQVGVAGGSFLSMAKWLGACFVSVMVLRICWDIYAQIWRYAGVSEFVKLVLSDGMACVFCVGSYIVFNGANGSVGLVAVILGNLFGCLSLRLCYQWTYQHRTLNAGFALMMKKMLKILTGVSFINEKEDTGNRIKIAIIGAGGVGAMLADELQKNPKAVYEPVCFVDIDEKKAGRDIGLLPVLMPEDDLKPKLDAKKVQEIVFALPNVSSERRRDLYEYYGGMGYKIKTYDYPILDSDESSKRRIHDFKIEDLLFRSTNQFLNDETKAWYRGKNVLITGGGGSIGSELARQIARCQPKRLVILDVYENGAYDIQQELRIKYGNELNLRVEIASVCDKEGIDKIFREHTPDIVMHAAAHKHVPLMERNVCEAVRNNVFGTLNVVEACEKYHVKRFIMVSTDKAVNPTNVMGATKRMCEMIVQSRSGENTSFSATRFGNVLGSNGSVIPLFKRQIAAGGPVTITDSRIVRYFMTIPEASQLVMTSGAMASNGELYVLDMGKPVKIISLAMNMIKLSGLEPYKDIDIVETGLRPGEKLYEELLIKTEELDKTENDKIYVERDKPLSKEEIAGKLAILEKALMTQSNHLVKEALMQVVPTYKSPEEVNEQAIQAEEMRQAAGA